MNDFFWIGPALLFGLLAARVGLPPMVGYLIGGFILNVASPSDMSGLNEIGEMGVTLLLFTIGLKLDLRSLLKPQIWAGASIHMLAVVVIFGALIFFGSLLGISQFAGLGIMESALIAFALSFSSTVFAVKILEEHGELTSRHGETAIGILIMQDIFAVIFLAFSTGKVPSVWALLLILLWPARRVIMYVLSRAGHGELLILLGFALTFGSYSLFDAVGVKGDLGALMVGALLASHPAAYEMSKKLMGFKDLLLVGFFLSIGSAGHITLSSFVIAAVLALLMFLKTELYFLMLTRFKLRARTSMLTSLNLANYSEFGLIVGSIALAKGWISGDWLVIIALSLTMTFIIAAPLNAKSRPIVKRFMPLIKRFETKDVLPEDKPIDVGDAQVAILGMRRLGTSAYDTLRAQYGDVVVGVEAEAGRIGKHQEAGRRVIHGDCSDEEFWERVHKGKAEVVVLTMGSFEQNMAALVHARERARKDVRIYAVAEYPEEIAELQAAGATAVWNLANEAGIGLAEHVIEKTGETVG